MQYHFADCQLDTASQRLTRAGDVVAIEPQVFDLLKMLAENADRMVTRDEIIDRVWGGRIVSESAISARIAAARKAVGDDGKRQAVIRTHHGRGLEMVAVVDNSAAINPAGQDTADVPKVRYTLSARGHSLAYLVSGTGSPLFQIDGPALSKEKGWHIPVLRESYDVYRKGRKFMQMDWAGSGLSEALDDALSFEEDVEDMISVADAAGIKEFALMSESGACFAAVTMAALHPDRVTRLIIVGGYAEGRNLRRNDSGPEVLKTLMEAGWDQHEGGIATAFLTAYFPEGPARAVRDMVGLMQQSASRAFALSLRERTNNASTLPLLGKVRCPTLIVHGRDDAVHPLVQAQKLAAGIPDSELLVLESANHLPIPGHPSWDRFVSAMRKFLDG